MLFNYFTTENQLPKSNTLIKEVITLNHVFVMLLNYFTAGNGLSKGSSGPHLALGS